MNVLNCPWFNVCDQYLIHSSHCNSGSSVALGPGGPGGPGGPRGISNSQNLGSFTKNPLNCPN
jgi:hypothetical protein